MLKSKIKPQTHISADRSASNQNKSGFSNQELAAKEYRTIIEITSDGFFICDVDGHILDVNDSLCQITGYSRHELLSMSIADIEASENQNEILNHIQKVIEQKSQRFESRHKRKDGTIIDVEISAHSFQNDHNQIIVFIRNITSQKLAERNLRESEKKYRQLVETMNEGLSMADKDYRFTFSNRYFLETLGYTWDEVVGHHITEFFDEKNKKIIAAQIGARKQGQEKSYDITWKAKDGHDVNSIISPKTFIDENGNFLGSLGIFIDITDRKKAEEALKESEQRYALAQRAANIASWDFDISSQQMKWSEQIWPILGLTKNQLNLTLDSFIEFIHPEDRQRIIDSFDMRPEKNEEHKEEYRIIWPDDSIHWISSTGNILKDENGKIVRMVGIVQDITERKQAEQARDEHLHDMNERIKELRCMYRVTKAIRCKDSLENLFKEILTFIPAGWQYPEITRAKIIFCGKEFVSKPFKETQWKQASDIIVEGQPCGAIEVYYLQQCPQKNEGPFLTEERNLIDSIAASISEAIEVRRAEEEIANTAKFPSECPYPILRIMKNGIIHYANTPGIELLKTLDTIVGDQVPENWRQYISGIFKTNTKKEFEVVSEEKVFSLTITPIIDGGYVNVYGVDITDRKFAEENLQKYRKHLEELVKDRTAKLTETNANLLRQIEKGKVLEKEILDVSEHEQRRIGRELHDSIGQQFAGIAFMTKVLEQKLSEKMPEESAYVAQIRELINEAIKQIRSLAKGLHPVDLSSTSLVSVLQEYTENIQKIYNIQCTFQFESESLVQDSETAVHLYRIIQEAVTNAIKHAKSKHIIIRLDSQKDKSILTVKNDGRSFPKNIENISTGMGLHIMKHRVDLIKGSLDIHTDDNGWTVLTCVFPNKIINEREVI